MWLRRLEGKWRKRPRRKKPPYWRELKDPRSWDPNVRRSPPEIRRGNGLLRRLKGSNKESTTEALQ